MRKTLPALLAVIILAACNKDKIKKEDLVGLWDCYKYLHRNIDRTDDFKAQNPGYYIRFDESGTFEESAIADITVDPQGNPDTTFAVVTGNWEFADNEKLILTDSVFTKRTYSIFNLQTDHVQLRSDTAQYYLVKREE